MTRVLFIFLLSLALAFGGVGCTTAAKRQQKAVAVGVYKINQSLKQGRVDLAQKYSNELIRIVPPPKSQTPVKRIEVKKADGTLSQYVVLPQEYKDKEVVTLDTPKFEEILVKNPEIKEQLAEEEKEVKKFEKSVDESLRATEKAAEKGDAASKSSWWKWGTGILGLTGIVGVIALCVFFPALIPILTGVFSSVVSVFNGIFGAIARLITKKPPS